MRRLTLLAVLLAALVAPAAASAGRLVTIDVPAGDVPGPARANVLLPDDYDPAKAYPLLLLLHGVGDAPNFPSWSRENSGRIVQTAAGLNAIVVMPEGGRGFYTDWFNAGKRGGPSWETYYLDTLLPFVESRYKIAPGRRNRAVAGNSMGGFGAAYLGSQRPDYFGSVASFSGFVQHQRAEAEAGLRIVGEVEYGSIFGPMDGAYATGHNPTRIAANLRSSRVFVRTGNGIADPAQESSPIALVGGGVSELELRAQADEFAWALGMARVPTDYAVRTGVHDWPYWRSMLREAMAWGLFKAVDEDPLTWELATVRRSGRAWGYRYAFASAPESVVTFRSVDGKLGAVGGSGSRVTVTDIATGCARTATLPASALTPAAICGDLRAKGSARRLRRGARRTLVVRLTGVRDDASSTPAVGAVVRFGASRAVADAQGVARLVVRPVGRPGKRLLRASAPGLRPVRVPVRVSAR